MLFGLNYSGWIFLRGLEGKLKFLFIEPINPKYSYTSKSFASLK